MDLSPESLDRHPFRIRKRGYDIMQVRKLLHEIGEELRARHRVSEDLADDSDPRATAEHEAREILARAERRAEAIVADAQNRASGSAIPGSRVEEMLAEAQQEAARIVDEAEVTARERSATVLAEAQLKLDRLIDRERDVAARLRLSEQRLRELSGGEIVAGGRDLRSASQPSDATDDVIDLDEPGRRRGDDSFADFVKAAVREEIGSSGSTP